MISQLEINLLNACEDFLRDHKDVFAEEFVVKPAFSKILPIRFEKNIENGTSRIEIEYRDGLDGAQIVGDQNQRAAPVAVLLDGVDAFGLEVGVPHGQHFIHQQDLGSGMDGHCKAQAHIHARGIVLDRHVDKGAQLGERNDPIQAFADLSAG